MLIMFGLSGCSRSGDSPPAPRTAVTVSSVRSMSKSDIEKMLGRLERRKAPKPQMGAMCYEAVSVLTRPEYVCPTCGEKTLYAKDRAPLVSAELEACRRELEIVKKSTKLALALDESAFCKHCSPDVDKPQLGLTITYADGASHSASPITRTDLFIVRDFLKGELSYTGYTEDTYPLKANLPRLRELLGAAETKENSGVPR